MRRRQPATPAVQDQAQAPERLVRFLSAEWEVVVPGDAEWDAAHAPEPWPKLRHLRAYRAWRDARQAWETETGVPLPKW